MRAFITREDCAWVLCVPGIKTVSTECKHAVALREHVSDATFSLTCAQPDYAVPHSSRQRADQTRTSAHQLIVLADAAEPPYTPYGKVGLEKREHADHLRTYGEMGSVVRRDIPEKIGYADMHTVPLKWGVHLSGGWPR